MWNTSDLNFNSGNSANAADKYSGEVLDLFDTGLGPEEAQYPTVVGPIALAGLNQAGICPEYTPVQRATASATPCRSDLVPSAHDLEGRPVVAGPLFVAMLMVGAPVGANPGAWYHERSLGVPFRRF